MIDHPYSPFLNVSPEMMKELAPVGILFNFTWDELSPLLGVDPQIMYNTIREVGPEYFTLSSDAGAQRKCRCRFRSVKRGTCKAPLPAGSR